MKGAKPPRSVRVLLAIALLIGALFGAWEVFAQPVLTQGRVCFKHTEMMAFLQKRYGETPRAVGVNRGGHSIMQILASPKGIWSVLIVTPRRLACIVAAGSGFEALATKPDETKS